MKSLVATVKNEASSLTAFLDAIDQQTEKPCEFIIVDGGSVDGTFELLQSWASTREDVRVFRLPGANIARGRNFGISMAQGDIIVVTDAGTVAEPSWFQKISEPVANNKCCLAGGLTVPILQSNFHRVLACANLPLPEEVKEAGFCPSSRNAAFSRDVWEKCGRYPEWLDFGEDMYFDLQARRAGVKIVFVRDAVVRWRLRDSLRDVFRQFFSYAKGDALAGMHAVRHAIRFLSYVFLLASMALAFLWQPALFLPIPFALVYVFRPLKRSFVYFGSRLRAVLRWPQVVLMMVYIDIAKMIGYASGHIYGRRRSWT